MNVYFSKICILILFAGQVLPSMAKVKVFPAPEGEVLSDYYQVTINGEESPVYKARTADRPFQSWEIYHGGEYGFTSFDFSGSVTVKISSIKKLSEVIIRPVSKNIISTVEDGELVITLTEPVQLSIEPDGKKNPLLIFANELESDIPDKNEPNVIYYAPGIHQINEKWIGSDKIIYVAGGAVLKGNFMIRGNNVTIRGRGIICQNDWGHYGTGFPVNIDGGYGNFHMEGVIVRGSCTWTIGLFNGDIATIENIKICGGRLQNDDGIDIVNFSNVEVKNCFIRTDDDCIAPKGIGSTLKNVENVSVTDCILWCDRARVFFFGYESQANYFRNITIENIDVIHQSMMVFQLQPDDELMIEDVHFNNIRINGTREGEKLRLQDYPIVSIVPMGNPVDQGHHVNVAKIIFDDISVFGDKNGDYDIDIRGLSNSHRVENIFFNDFDLFGSTLLKTSPNVNIGNYTSNINFNESTGAHLLEESRLSVDLYSNPIEADMLQFKIELTGVSDINIIVRDMSGAIVQSKKVTSVMPGESTYALNMEKCPSGVYFLIINADDKIIRKKKFIKNQGKYNL